MHGDASGNDYGQVLIMATATGQGQARIGLAR